MKKKPLSSVGSVTETQKRRKRQTKSGTNTVAIAVATAIASASVTTANETPPSAEGEKKPTVCIRTNMVPDKKKPPRLAIVSIRLCRPQITDTIPIDIYGLAAVLKRDSIVRTMIYDLHSRGSILFVSYHQGEGCPAYWKVTDVKSSINTIWLQPSSSTEAFSGNVNDPHLICIARPKAAKPKAALPVV